MGILKRGGKAPVSSTRSWCCFQAITQKYRLYVSMHIKITAKLQGQTVPCMGRRDLLHIPRHLPSNQETASTTNQPWDLHCQSRHRASRDTYLCYSIEEHAEPRNWTSVPKASADTHACVGGRQVKRSSNVKIRKLVHSVGNIRRYLLIAPRTNLHIFVNELPHPNQR